MANRSRETQRRAPLETFEALGRGEDAARLREQLEVIEGLGGA